MYACNCHTPLQTGLKITNRQHTLHSLFFNYQSPCVYTYLVYLTYYLPLQQEIWLAVHSRSNLIGVTYIHLSLTHSLTHSPIDPSITYPTRQQRGIFFYKKKKTQKWLSLKLTLEGEFYRWVNFFTIQREMQIVQGAFWS